MSENTLRPPQLSVHILLPESINRRLERWTHKMEGASWPAWGGHVTLVPNFVAHGEPGQVRAAIEAVCTDEEPFTVRLGAPLAVQDSTRPDYSAVFLAVEGVLADVESDTGEEGASEQASRQTSEQGHDAALPIAQLRQKILDALEPLREDLYPQLVAQKFMPHVTLALSLGELEAQKLVRDIRADPLTAEFKVEVVWLVTQTFGENGRFERLPIPLGQLATAELMRD